MGVMEGFAGYGSRLSCRFLVLRMVSTAISSSWMKLKLSTTSLPRKPIDTIQPAASFSHHAFCCFVRPMLTMTSNRHGAQGVLDSASKATMENEFGTNKDDEVIIKILEKGSVQESEVCHIQSSFYCIIEG